jgi:hypothetical protein
VVCAMLVVKVVDVALRCYKIIIDDSIGADLEILDT